MPDKSGNFSDSEQALKELLVSCEKGYHALKSIFKEYDVAPCVENVVRWCSICGSVVVDQDSAGIVFPGRIMPMKSPAITKRLLKKKKQQL
jgi:hypothetical protein